jgi:hypothetical protein
VHDSKLNRRLFRYSRLTVAHLAIALRQGVAWQWGDVPTTWAPPGSAGPTEARPRSVVLSEAYQSIILSPGSVILEEGS